MSVPLLHVHLPFSNKFMSAPCPAPGQWPFAALFKCSFYSCFGISELLVKFTVNTILRNSFTWKYQFVPFYVLCQKQMVNNNTDP